MKTGIREIAGNVNSLNKMLQARVLGKKFPLSVTFIITYRCNFSCRYCKIFRFKEEEMRTGQIISMIDQLISSGMRRFSINGGEPLLREDIGEIIGYAKRKGLLVTVFTNGYLVSEKIDALRELDIMLISLDGPREVHDAQRMPGA